MSVTRRYRDSVINYIEKTVESFLDAHVAVSKDMWVMKVSATKSFSS